ncbi:MAG: aldehyde dehydrogenase EutE [Gemmataceae bacterium]|nr:aldehyde dehydrogenase EutE [Gemmataceae bacterium]MDW8267231.1 aldehyde dehydrogenase EutE [Gemmataceae bacterium]
MQVTDELIRSIVQDVLAQMRSGPSRPTNGQARPWGVFDDVNSAVQAAVEAQRQFERRGLADRRKAVDCIRRICSEHAEALGREEFEETKIGRLPHKIEKLKVIAERIPGVEFLKTEAFSGEHGITLQEYAPFGVIGVVTPVTHSLPTLACNAINMLAAGNALVCNPHPAGAQVAVKGTRLFNQAIHEAIGIDNLVTIIAQPTLETAQAIFDHRDVKMLCVTGGAALGRAALRSPKRAVVAGPGNPPVVVDETADLENAARSIVAGAAYDNNLLCIGEKEVFAVASIFDELLDAVARAKGVRLDAKQIESLTRVAFVDDGKGHLSVNKDLIGQDAAILARHVGLTVPADTEILFGETLETNPFVSHEQMMPFIPFVRVPDVDTAIALAKKYEHGFKHTAIIHSRNVETITRMGRELDTTLFIQNGPSMAGLGSGGEGYLSFSIATPTGEGVTTPLTFTRQRRTTTVGSLRIV